MSLYRVEKISRKIFSRMDGFTYDCHVSLVYKHAKALLKEYPKANRTAVLLAALLHDIGRPLYGGKDHHVTGSREARKILSTLKYPEAMVAKVERIILRHEAFGKNIPQTLEEKILTCADALSHYDALPFFFNAAYVHLRKDLPEGYSWVYDKFLVRDWENKLVLPKARKMALAKYKALGLLLKPLKTRLYTN